MPKILPPEVGPTILQTSAIRPGMVIRSTTAVHDADCSKFRRVTAVHPLSLYSEVQVHFEDGTVERWHKGHEFQVSTASPMRMALRGLQILQTYALAEPASSTTPEAMAALTVQVLGHYAAEIHDASTEQLHHLDERFESQPKSPFILRVREMVAAEITLRDHLVGGAA